MIEEILQAIWEIGTADPALITFWSCPGDPPSTPLFFLGMAPDDTPMPYVTYDLYASGGGDGIWPMGTYRLEFRVYDFGTDKTRIMGIVQRVIELYAWRGYEVDTNKAIAVRTYEADGPARVETGAKIVSAYSIGFTLRALNVGALDAQTLGPR
jgi:hypothetical protein